MNYSSNDKCQTKTGDRRNIHRRPSICQHTTSRPSRKRQRPWLHFSTVVGVMVIATVTFHKTAIAWTPLGGSSRSTVSRLSSRRIKSKGDWRMATDSRELRFKGGTTTLLQEGVLGQGASIVFRQPVLGSSSSTSSMMSQHYQRQEQHSSQQRHYHQSSSMMLSTVGVVGGMDSSVLSLHEIVHTLNRSWQSFATITTSAHGGREDEQEEASPFFCKSTAATSVTSPAASVDEEQQTPLVVGYGEAIPLSEEERNLFSLLRRVRKDTNLDTTLRVAGGWVRDKLLATPEFRGHTSNGRGQRLTSKFHKPNTAGGSMGRQGTKVLLNGSGGGIDGSCTAAPVDIDIALDDALGREFADHLNEYLSAQGEETVSVGVVLKNPEKSKHLETATMKVGSFWIDFVNLRAEEYTQDSRIPDLMRIGTASEDAHRRDLTINALFYNINTGEVEDWTGQGFEDLRKGVVATPLAPLTTLLDDPLRVLRSIRFAARLRFTMANELVEAAKDARVRTALDQKVSRERVGGEVDLMLRSPDPVGAMRLLINLELASTVFPVQEYMKDPSKGSESIFASGLELLSTAHDYLADCRFSPPLWCVNKQATFGANEVPLLENSEARRLLWYASFIKPLWDENKMQEQPSQEKQEKCSKRSGKKSNRSSIVKLLVDDLKRPVRDAEAVEKVIRAADEFTAILEAGGDVSSTMILLNEVRVSKKNEGNGVETLICSMNGRRVDSTVEDDPVWNHAMEFRQELSKVLRRVGHLWRAALILSLSEFLAEKEFDDDGIFYAIEGDVIDESQEERRLGVIERFDVFATAIQLIGLVGIWNESPLLDGGRIKQVLPGIPKGPAFRDVMEAQVDWMTTHPAGDAAALARHLIEVFPEYAQGEGK